MPLAVPEAECWPLQPVRIGSSGDIYPTILVYIFKRRCHSPKAFPWANRPSTGTVAVLLKQAIPLLNVRDKLVANAAGKLLF